MEATKKGVQQMTTKKQKEEALFIKILNEESLKSLKRKMANNEFSEDTLIKIINFLWKKTKGLERLNKDYLAEINRWMRGRNGL